MVGLQGMALQPVTMRCSAYTAPAAKVAGELRLPQAQQKAGFRFLYTKEALFEAALKVYTKPLFFREKCLLASHDGQTLYHFAVQGTRNVDRLHRLLSAGSFHFREGVELRFNRSGKCRVAYIFPWEERIVDVLLYQMLNKFFHGIFSQRSYAFRYRSYGIDSCQRHVTRSLRAGARPLYIIKRDVANYYPSINQDLLLALLGQWLEPNDYLYELLRERVKFAVRNRNGERVEGRGIPFGSAAACVLANIYLTPLDVAMSGVPELTYFRYADDVLAFSPDREAVREGRDRFSAILAQLRLKSKPSHETDIHFAKPPASTQGFTCLPRFQHLGLEFRVDGTVGLPRPKRRKIRNLFRAAFQEVGEKLAALRAPEQRARLLVSAARQVIEHSCRSIAIMDYYLKHVDDEEQLRLLDRWLAEEVLSWVFGKGHRKGNFRTLSFETLRRMGLPSLRHRHRLLHHHKLQSSFFSLWTKSLVESSLRKSINQRGRRRGDGCQVVKTLSPDLEAAAFTAP